MLYLDKLVIVRVAEADNFRLLVYGTIPFCYIFCATSYYAYKLQVAPPASRLKPERFLSPLEPTVTGLILVVVQQPPSNTTVLTPLALFKLFAYVV
jgi:hypothetical protein